jgi:hypothetical protein
MIAWLTMVAQVAYAGLNSRQNLVLENLALRHQLLVLSRANPLWGAPRIHGEWLKLGLAVAQRSAAKYMIRRSRRPTSPNRKTFLRNHIDSMVSVDFLTVPTLRTRNDGLADPGPWRSGRKCSYAACPAD